MITELASFAVMADRAQEFEKEFVAAAGLVRAAPGALAVSLLRCAERPGDYVFVVDWERIEDHTERFAHSAEFQQFASVLGRYLVEGPRAEHFQKVFGL